MKKLHFYSMIMLLAAFMMYTDITYSHNTSEKTITIKCKEMSCEGCKKEITRSIKTIEGIINIDINLDTHLIKVSFDETKTSPKKIIEAIADAGYESELVE